MIVYIIWYLALGFGWAGFLEWFTTTKLEGEYAKDWKWIERLFHSLLWPLSFYSFAINFLRGLFGGPDEE